MELKDKAGVGLLLSLGSVASGKKRSQNGTEDLHELDTGPVDIFPGKMMTLASKKN